MSGSTQYTLYFGAFLEKTIHLISRMEGVVDGNFYANGKHHN
jgi:hypothetical protein